MGGSELLPYRTVPRTPFMDSPQRLDRAFHRIAVRLAIAAPALVREVQPLRGASTNQPSLPAYARALTNWQPSNPISKAFFSIHAFVLGARVSIPASANACSNRIASARSIGRAATSDELDDSISKFAFDCAFLNRPVRLYVQNRGHASVFADLIAKPRSIHQRMLKNHRALLHHPSSPPPSKHNGNNRNLHRACS